MLRLASLIFCAISRRTPVTLISSVSARAKAAGIPRGAGLACEPPADTPFAMTASRSSRTIRPLGPLPCIRERSMPASCARLRIAGEVETRPVRASEPLPEDAPRTEACATMVASSLMLWPLSRAAPDAGRLAPGAVTAAAPSPSFACVSKTMSSAPTGTHSPGLPVVETTVPLTGAGTSTAALSVMTSTITSSSATRSPGLTRHATISASTVPSPRSGNLNTCRLIAVSVPHAACITACSAAAIRCGPGKYSHSNACGYGVSQPVTR